MKNLKILQVILVVVFMLFIGWYYQNHALSFHFVDEEDNFVLGKYLLSGEKLYSNLFSHHQPLGYIISAGVQNVTDPNSVFLLVKRHREFMILWSIVWSVALVVRLGTPAILFVVIYELSKNFLLGNLFLSESIIVYPFIFLSSLIYQKISSQIGYLILIGIIFGVSFMLLSPLWPALAFILLIFAWQFKNKRKNIIYIALGILVVLISSLYFLSLPDYFHNAFYINYTYYIPMTSGGIIGLESLKSFISPLIPLLNWQNNTATAQIIRWMSIALIIDIVLLAKKKQFKIIILFLVLLGLSNLRYIEPGQQEYSGFHLIPWYGLLIFSTSFLTFAVFKLYSNKIKLILIPLFVAILMLAVFENKNNLFKPANVAQDYYINYSRQIDFGDIIKIMKSDGDRLFVVPDEWLIYWQADISHAHKMVNLYAWMTQVPEIDQSVVKMFDSNPPEFFYCDCKGSYSELRYFFNKYSVLVKDGKETRVLVLKEKINRLTSQQKERLKFYNASII